MSEDRAPASCSVPGWQLLLNDHLILD